MESKYKTLLDIPEEWRPRSVMVSFQHSLTEIKNLLQHAQLSFPIIAKPDIGYRGFLVHKIENLSALNEFLAKYPVNFILQEYLDYPCEGGVLYYRFPNQQKGRITSLTLKEFLTVRGDGRSSLRELILAKPRALLQLDRLEEQFGPEMEKVIPESELVPLGYIGNHNKGTAFMNGNHLIDEDLQSVFDQISHRIPGVFYGRFDIKYQSLDQLKSGKNFKIIEINGVLGEPTHIYDPLKSSYFRAVADIGRHWNIARQIGEANHARGITYTKPKIFFKALAEHVRYRKQFKQFIPSPQSPQNINA